MLSDTLSPTLLDFGSTIYLRARSFGTVTFLGGQLAPLLPTHSHAGAGYSTSVAIRMEMSALSQGLVGQMPSR
jgi:hypothetical protein